MWALSIVGVIFSLHLLWSGAYYGIYKRHFPRYGFNMIIHTYKIKGNFALIVGIIYVIYGLLGVYIFGYGAPSSELLSPFYFSK